MPSQPPNFHFFPEVTIDLIPNVPHVKETILIWVSRIYIYYVTSSLWDLAENWFHAKLNREVVKLGREVLSQMASYSLQSALVLTRQIGWHLECSATVHTDLRVTTAHFSVLFIRSWATHLYQCLSYRFWIPIHTYNDNYVKMSTPCSRCFSNGCTDWLQNMLRQWCTSSFLWKPQINCRNSFYYEQVYPWNVHLPPGGLIGVCHLTALKQNV
jgi:hypothetical protein